MPDVVWHWLGLAVAFGGLGSVLVLMRLNHAKGLRRCKRCRYDLADRPEPSKDAPVTCPECGTRHTTLEELKRSRRREARALAGIAVAMLTGYAVWVVPRVQSEGASGFVPTAALALAVPILDRTANRGAGWVSWQSAWLFEIAALAFERMHRPCNQTVGTMLYAWFELTGVDDADADPDNVMFIAGDWQRELVTTGSLLPWQLRGRVVRDAEDLIVDIQFFKLQVSAEHWVNQLDAGHIAMPQGWTLTITGAASRSSLRYTFKSNSSGGTMPRFDDDAWHGQPLEIILRDESETPLAAWTANIVPAPTSFTASRLAKIQANWGAGKVKLIAIVGSIVRVDAEELAYPGH